MGIQTETNVIVGCAAGDDGPVEPVETRLDLSRDWHKPVDTDGVTLSIRHSPFPFLPLIYAMPPSHILHLFIIAFALQTRANPLAFLWSCKATAVQSFQDQSWLW